MFIAGYACPVAYSPRGLFGGYLKITGWDGTEEVTVKESTHSEAEGQHCCVTGRFLFAGTVVANLDTILFPWSATFQLKAGGRGSMEFYVFSPTANPLARFKTGVRILKVNHRSAVAGLVSWSLNVISNKDEPWFDRFEYPQ